jgi:hypothetical protein
MANKFNKGERVVMTAETRQFNSWARSFAGVVHGYSTRYPEQVKLRRDGLLTVEMWHEDAWELESARPSALGYAGKPC